MFFFHNKFSPCLLNSLARERGHIKQTEWYKVPRDMDNSRKETRRWSGYADWWEIWNWKREVDAREGTKITEKWGMVVWGINMEADPVNLAHIHAEIVPIHENHVDARTILIWANHVDAKVTHIPENLVDNRIIHVHASMLTGVQIPQRSDVPTTQLWMLWATLYEELLGRCSRMKLNGPQCRADSQGYRLITTMGRRTRYSTLVITSIWCLSTPTMTCWCVKCFPQASDLRR